MQRKSFAPGEVVFRQGDQSDEAYWIVSGKIEISIETPAGREILSTLDDGEIFGEMGMIDDRPREATARALIPTELEVITLGDFREQLVRHEDRLMRYLDALFDRLRTTNALLRTQLGKHWTEARMASGPPVDRIEETLPPITVLSTEASAGMFPNGLHLRITRFPFRIGRRTDDGFQFSPMDLPLQDQRPYRVSRSHCRIECQGGGYSVRDLGSLHGTIVNGVPIGSDASSLTANLVPGENSIVIGPKDGPHHYWLMVG